MDTIHSTPSLQEIRAHDYMRECGQSLLHLSILGGTSLYADIHLNHRISIHCHLEIFRKRRVPVHTIQINEHR
jgi:hypothetical protein